MTQIVLEFRPEDMSALRKGPAEVANEVKAAAVIQWYAEKRVSQSKAEILAISRSRFLDELYRRHVPAAQIDIDELREELKCLNG